MLRVYEISKNGKFEISPVNNVYTVNELGKYEILYFFQIYSGAFGKQGNTYRRF